MAPNPSNATVGQTPTQPTQIQTNGTSLTVPSSLDQQSVDYIEDRIKNALSEAKDLKKDILTSFGIFAALLIFASLEVQVLAKVPRFSLMVGMSSFFASSMILFAVSLHNVVTGKNTWKDYKTPIFGLVFLFMLVALVCFAYAFLCPPGWGLKILGLR